MKSDINVSKLRPINGKVFVKQKIEDQKTEPGIIISLEKVKHKIESKGEIICFDSEIGEQCYVVLKKGKKPTFETRELKAGDIAFFDQYAGKYQIINNEEYIVLGFDEIIGIVEDGNITIEFNGGGLENLSMEQLQQHMN